MATKAFEFEITLNKAYKAEDGTMHVVGVASDDDVDLVGDKMHEKALESMVDQAKRNKLPLLDSHHSTFGFGHTHDSWLKKSGARKEMAVDFALDSRYPQAHDLYNEVAGGNCTKQLSIGGGVNRADDDAVSYEYDDKAKRHARVLKKVKLDHIAATRPGRAAVPRTRFLDAIIKDIFGGEPMPTDLPLPPATVPGNTAIVLKTDTSTAEPPTKGVVPPENPPAKTDREGGTNAQAALGKEAATNNTTKEKTMVETNANTTQPATTPINKATDSAQLAQIGLEKLAQLGTLFGGAGGSPAPTMPEHIAALDKAIGGLVMNGITEKSTPEVKRMVGALHKFLGGAGVKILDNEDREKSGVEHTNKGLDEKAIQAMIDNAITAKASAFGKEVGETIKSVSETISKGFESLTTKMSESNKAFDERLGKMEKVAGVRQSLPGQDPTTPVTKSIDGSPSSARRPDAANPFRGMFDRVRKEALAQFGAAAATNGTAGKQ